jgi:hypothetical protein
LGIGGGVVAFLLLPDLPGVAFALGLVSGVVAAITARSKAVLTFDPADMTAHEKRRLLAVTTSLILVGGLAWLGTAFLVAPESWFVPAWLESLTPSLRALLVFGGAFFIGLAVLLASGLSPSISREG